MSHHSCPVVFIAQIPYDFYVSIFLPWCLLPVYQKGKTSPVIMLSVNQDHGKKNPRTDNFCGHLTSTLPAMTLIPPAAFKQVSMSSSTTTHKGFLFPVTLAQTGKKCFAAQALGRKQEGRSEALSGAPSDALVFSFFVFQTLCCLVSSSNFMLGVLISSLHR